MEAELPAPLFPRYSGVELGKQDVLLRVGLVRRVIRSVMTARAGIIHAHAGSGKTSLLQLIEHYLTSPDYETPRRLDIDQRFAFAECVHIDLLNSLRVDSVHTYLYSTNPFVRGIFPGGVEALFTTTSGSVVRFILLDEAQIAYNAAWDPIWSLLKSTIRDPSSNIRILIAASYGRRAIDPIISTPVEIPYVEDWRILAFSQDEVLEFRNGFNAEYGFHVHDDAARIIYRLTNGNPNLVGTMFRGLRDAFKTETGRAALTVEGQLLYLGSKTMFNHMEHSRSIVKLANLPAFVRGNPDTFPDPEEGVRLCRKDLARVLQEGPHDENPGDNVEKLLIKYGWLHRVLPENSLRPVQIDFSSEMQRLVTFVEYAGKLNGVMGTEIPDLPTIIMATLGGLRPDVLRGTLGVGAGQIPLERTWQMEFYRAARTTLPDRAYISPDVGYAFDVNGYVDFYIQGLSSGLVGYRSYMVELLREGHRLQQHIDRFYGQGPYASIPHDDWIILNFFRYKGAKRIKAHSNPKVWRLGYLDDFTGGWLYRLNHPREFVKFHGTIETRREAATRSLRGLASNVLARLRGA